MRIKRKVVSCIALMLSCVLLFSLNTSAEGVTVATTTVTHTHTAQTGSCYSPVYHVHQGNTTSGGVCYQTPVYHSHSGNTTSGGACFSKANYHSHSGSANQTYSNGCYTRANTTTEQVYCGQWIAGGSDLCNCQGYPPQMCEGATCSGCGDISPHCPGGYAHSIEVETTVYELGCGKSTSTIESYSQTCTKTGSTIDSYKLSCSKNGNTIDSYSLKCTKGTSQVAKFSMVKDFDSTSYKLSISTVSKNNDVTVTGYSWSTGSAESSINVTGNGTYTCTVNISDGGISRSTTLQYVVTDYDTSPPTVRGISHSNGRVSSHDVVTVTAEDNVGATGYMLSK